jgi:hypothetical protein
MVSSAAAQQHQKAGLPPLPQARLTKLARIPIKASLHSSDKRCIFMARPALAQPPCEGKPATLADRNDNPRRYVLKAKGEDILWKISHQTRVCRWSQQE